MKRIINAVIFKIGKGLKRVRKFFFIRIIRKPEYYNISNSQLFINWFFQRVLRQNSDVPYSVSFTSTIQGANRIILPQNAESIKISFAVSGGCYFTAFAGTTLEIGEGTLWANNVCVQTGNHDLIDRRKYNLASVKIGKNCWLGTSVTILAGVELGNNVTVGANSVVTKSFPSNCVIAGVPAKIIKQINA